MILQIRVYYYNHIKKLFIDMNDGEKYSCWLRSVILKVANKKTVTSMLQCTAVSPMRQHSSNCQERGWCLLRVLLSLSLQTDINNMSWSPLITNRLRKSHNIHSQLPPLLHRCRGSLREAGSVHDSHTKIPAEICPHLVMCVCDRHISTALADLRCGEQMREWKPYSVQSGVSWAMSDIGNV